MQEIARTVNIQLRFTGQGFGWILNFLHIFINIELSKFV